MTQLQWNLIWRSHKPLKFNLHQSIQAIDAELRLHNFILDYNIQHGIRNTHERSTFDEDCNYFLSSHHDAVVGTVRNDEGRGRGRPTLDEVEQRNADIDIRDETCARIRRDNLVRPLRNWYRD